MIAGDSPEAPPPSIALNRTQATLNCSAGYMSVFIVIAIAITIVISINIATKNTTITTIITLRSVQLQFKQEFFGIVYADYDRNSACKVTEISTLKMIINPM